MRGIGSLNAGDEGSEPVQTLTRRRLTVAALLAGVAGYVDGFAFVYLGGYFVSFMSGNTTRAGVGLAEGMLPVTGLALLLVSSFVLGAMAGALASDAERDRSIRILALVVAALAAAAALAGWGVRGPAMAFVAFGMGAVNTVFGQNREVSFGITYMTGALVKIGQGLVIALRGGDRTAWARYLLLWVSIASGAVVGAAAYGALGSGALWFAIGGVVLAGVVLAWGRRR